MHKVHRTDQSFIARATLPRIFLEILPYTHGIVCPRNFYSFQGNDLKIATK